MRIKSLPYILITLLICSCSNKNTEGKKLYQSQCMNCHQENGQGVGKLIPPISSTFLAEHKNDIPCIIKNGLKGEIIVNGITYDHEMPKNNKISDFDLVNVLNYIEEEFGSGKKDKFNIEEVKGNLKRCQ